MKNVSKLIGGDKANATVFKTEDYGKFKFIEGNRDIDESHVAALVKSKSTKELELPITVNEKFEIIDGQHRFLANAELKLPIFYLIKPGYGLIEVQTLNQNTKNWTLSDHVDSECKKNNPNYIILKNFKEKYGFGYGDCITILSGLNSNKHKKFRSGNFIVINEKEGIETAELLLMIKPYYSGWKRKYFVHAMLRLLKNPNFYFDEFLRKLSIQQTKMVDCVSVNSYVDLIEEIYNYKRQGKVNLRY